MNIRNLWILLIAGMLIAGCDQPATEKMDNTGMAAESVEAMASMKPTRGNNVSGEVHFTQTGKGTRIIAEITGLQPGRHGFHIHEKGDCSAPDGTSAGGHYNPQGVQHGGPEDQVRHYGDLGNLRADSSGKATYERLDRMVSLTGDHSAVGRAVIIHAGEDDLESQPTGAAGPRLACGVIVRSPGN